jgi:hypothetical protein
VSLLHAICRPIATTPLPVYNIASPANNPPAIAPATLAAFATAAPVFCAGAEAEDAADEVCEAEVEKDEDCDALEDRSTDDEDTDAEREALVCTDCDAVTDPDNDAEETRDRMNVGVSTVVGTALLSVG